MSRLKSLVLYFMCLLHIGIYAHQADLIIFSFDRPLQLYALLESIEQSVRNLGTVTVIYRTSSDAFDRAYQEVQKTFDAIEYVQQSKNPNSDFKYLTMEALYACPHDHILFAVDDIVVTRPIDLDVCIQEMEAVHAYGFYLRMGLNIEVCYAANDAPEKPPRGKTHKNDFLIWRFKDGRHDWQYPNTVDMCIYRKQDVIRKIATLSFDTPNVLESRWAGKAWEDGSFNKYGMCYKESMLVNLPLNRVQTNYGNRYMNYMTAEQLLAEFNAGKKMDIQPLQGIMNKSPHMNYTPTFIARD